jgi:protocatechuate 3,4-dioxygenase beta subunit
VEIWQADTNGIYRHPRAQGEDSRDPHFLYFSRVKTNRDGIYLFKTIVPGAYDFHGNTRAPHIHIKMRSVNDGVLTTQVYFEGEEHERLREKDRVFQGTPKESRTRLIVPMESPGAYSHMDIDFEQDAVCCKYDLAFF